MKWSGDAETQAGIDAMRPGVWLAFGLVVVVFFTSEVLPPWQWWVEATSRPADQQLADLAIPAAVGLASIAIAAASWRTASKAAKIAVMAESGNNRRAHDERQERYTWRLESATAELMKEISVTMRDITTFERDEGDMGSADQRRMSAAIIDSLFDLSTSSLTVRVLAHGEDAEFLDGVRDKLREAAARDTFIEAREDLMILLSLMTLWRTRPEIMTDPVSMLDEIESRRPELLAAIRRDE